MSSLKDRNIQHEEEENLHSVAGLIDVGVDEDGLIEWLGTPKQWALYEELESKANI